MKVGLVTTWNTTCGIAQYSKYLATALIDKGCEVTILAEHAKHKHIVDTSNDITVIRCWARQEYHLDGVLSAIKDQSIDILHFQHEYSLFDDYALLHCLKELESAKIKKVLTMHSVVNGMVTEARIAPFLDGLIVHSEACKRSLINIERYADITEVIPQGSKELVYQDIQKLRRQYEIKEKPIIASFGFMQPHKGFQFVLEALPIIKKRYPNILYLIISAIRSDKPESLHHYWTLRRMAYSLGIARNVRFYPYFLDEKKICDLLQLADAIVLYYIPLETTHATSAAARFALATHRPLVVSDVTYFEDLHKEAVKVTPNNPQELANALINLLQDEEHQYNLIKISKKFISRTIWPRIANEHLRLYSDTLENKTKAGVSDNRLWTKAATRGEKSLAACYIVYNEERFIEYSIKSIYDYVDQIIVIDGSPKGPSTDKTREIVESFGRAKIIYKQGVFKNKEEQRNEYLKYVNSDWILVVDGDEVYKFSHMRRLREIIANRDDIVAVHIDHIHFWVDFHHYRIGGDFSRLVYRCSIYQTGMYYKVHHSIATPDGRFINKFSNIYYDETIKIYHYGYVKSEQEIRDKMIYYARRGDVGWEYQQKPEDYAIYYITQEWRLDRPGVYRYSGTHPEVMQPLIQQ